MKRRKFFRFVTRGMMAAGYVGAFGLPAGTVAAAPATAPEGQRMAMVLESYWLEPDGQWYRNVVELGGLDVGSDRPSLMHESRAPCARPDGVFTPLRPPGIVGKWVPCANYQQMVERMV